MIIRIEQMLLVASECCSSNLFGLSSLKTGGIGCLSAKIMNMTSGREQLTVFIFTFQIIQTNFNGLE